MYCVISLAALLVSLFVAFKWLPDLRILTGYFTVQLMNYNNYYEIRN